MRTRSELEAEIKFFDDIEDILPKLTLEVLLDIRDLLQSLKPPTIITTREDADARTRN